MKPRTLDRVLADLTARLAVAADTERKVAATLTGRGLCGPAEESLDLLAELVGHLRKRGVIDQVKPRRKVKVKTLVPPPAVLV